MNKNNPINQGTLRQPTFEKRGYDQDEFHDEDEDIHPTFKKVGILSSYHNIESIF